MSVPLEPRVAPRHAGPDARRVLVVEDNVDLATSLALLLKFDGHDTRTAHDGLEALSVAEAFRPQVLLVDVGLPKMNGYEVAQQIRAQPWGAGMALVALTGWGQEEDRRRAKDVGFDMHIAKPVDGTALRRIVASFPLPCAPQD